MLTGQVDQSGSDMCHHCKGDTWHVRTTTCGRVQLAVRVDDVTTGNILV
jgi:hypothetical protein